MQKLPKILEREPLVDAVFEVRLKETPPLADILPGFLYHELNPKPLVQRLPAAEIPQPLRASDPNLQFAPILRLEWDQYFIAVGDRSFAISCKLPYPKWPNFKKAILDITRRIAKVGIAGTVERYSVKYVNLIQGSTLAEQTSKIRMAITLGPIEVSGDHINLQVHRNDGDVVHILSVISGAEGNLPDGKRIHGAVVDIDSIRNVNAPNFGVFADNLEPGLEKLRQANKVMFFGCLTDATIEELGPVYE
jgi:uncharacterized protein (TIGR04255 family)